MKFAFRTDASVEIGTGHVMRCLTLASELKNNGHDCIFISRGHAGNLATLINELGFELYTLAFVRSDAANEYPLLWNDHAHWLGVHWQIDAKQTLDVLDAFAADWLVVDHYSIDSKWEQKVANGVNKIMVIDDLVDREHHCHLLLDQTFGRLATEYKDKVPEYCQVLCGTNYALLRPEFSLLRACSLKRRTKPELHQLLITMGGVDKYNATGKVLDALRHAPLNDECKIVVVLGKTSPWLKTLQRQSCAMPWRTEVKVGVDNMAKLMAESDLAIGAAGATSWERCCLGVPTISVTIAENQKSASEQLQKEGAVVDLPLDLNLVNNLTKIISNLKENPLKLKLMSESARRITKGNGVKSVVDEIFT